MRLIICSFAVLCLSLGSAQCLEAVRSHQPSLLQLAHKSQSFAQLKGDAEACSANAECQEGSCCCRNILTYPACFSVQSCDKCMK